MSPRSRKRSPVWWWGRALFPPEAIGPPGLRYYPEIITPSLELDLIERIRGLALLPFQFGAFEGKRRVASFGFKYDYGQQRLSEAEEIPEWLRRQGMPTHGITEGDEHRVDRDVQPERPGQIASPAVVFEEDFSVCRHWFAKAASRCSRWRSQTA